MIRPRLDRPAFDADILLPRIARTRLDSLLLPDRPSRRAVVVGTAGSGKTRLLQSIRSALAAAGAPTTWIEPGRVTAPPSTTANTVLFVDDLDLLDDEAMQRIVSATEDASASVIASVHPGPVSADVDRIMHVLERASAAIVIGSLTAADLTEPGTAPEHARECIDELIGRTGGIAWLMTAALSLHPTACDDPAGHSVIHAALIDEIAHRVEMLDPAVRDAVEAACLAEGDALDPALAARAHAAGLAQRGGRASPLVRSAVVATAAASRVADNWPALAADHVDDVVRLAPLAVSQGDPQAAARFAQEGWLAVPEDAARAAALFEAAALAGGAPDCALGQAIASFGLGDIDAAALRADSLLADDDGDDRLSDLSASLWAARGLPDQADAVYRARPPTAPTSRASAAVSALAIGDAAILRADELDPSAAATPTTRSVAADFLRRGLRDTVDGDGAHALDRLVRASSLTTASGGADPMPEYPAVLAALTAINTGELEIAERVLADALQGRQGGGAAADRLRLWSAWVAILQDRPHEAGTSLEAAEGSGRALGERDRLLAAGIRLALARRYSDHEALSAQWRRSRASLLSARFDLYSLHVLGEFVIAAARLQLASSVLDRSFADALELVDGLGGAPCWAAHAHWTGIQRAILHSSPEELKPHARALVAAAPRSRVAARMAHAGRVWTTVLAASVDGDEVESAAKGLASVGLAWDGARLAGHGAARSSDRKVSARLLACARQLHPHGQSATVAGDPVAPAPAVDAGVVTPAGVLSPREREVAELVVQGKTYVEIGQAMFISPRTAEHHIARIRTRLSATSRSDLMAKLRATLGGEPDPGLSP
ncbi:DNA-binding CsgD family transcriptional regulator [Microbacterium terrae]|uniref:Response regulator FixJ n=1 Tax=Microbacterium terrae TaxID=69369 RepID=A0A0M2H9W4_9MICO|nr:helix-turn-helix transcriptional regulator [Microbacterium terrae]KJL40949.1 response regulator FixJ [Microbacterium terrae]MBP1078238.1 DNA-binding CsgD family transcriptional regulator [Microbacterium terrae]GLJ97717.1 LuxR family transcriptional regulator [Microbacterium terrae]